MFQFHLFLTDGSLASSEESGKDWSELEEEAAQADKHNENTYVDDYTAKKRKVMSSKSSRDNSMKRRHDDDKHGHHSKNKKHRR